MTLTISKNANINYLAKIIQINNFTNHPNADNLKLCTVDGNIIAVSKQYEPGIYVYFPLECQISDYYLKNNNLYRHSNLNTDETISGFFDDNGRVKCIKLRGLLSQGLIMPFTSLIKFDEDVNFNNTDSFINAEFDTVNNKHLCWKYVIITKNKGVSLKDKIVKSKQTMYVVDKQFNFHINTPQFGKNMYAVNPNDIIQISLKEHGTSAIFCNLLTKKKISIFDKIIKFIKRDKNIDAEYTKFCSSRKVIKNSKLNKDLTQGYYDYDIWNLGLSVVEPFLQKGMSMYAEIVGYTPSGGYIQNNYDYNCIYNPKHHDYKNYTAQQMYDAKLFDIIIYRITSTNIDGNTNEWSALNVQQFCKLTGLHPVKELFYGKPKEIITESTEYDWNEQLFNHLKEAYCTGKSTICTNDVYEEGIVIRRENINIDVFKLKSILFLEHETKMLDKGIINIEDNE